MSAGHILAIDQGTTNTKALLVDAGGAIVARASRPLDIRFPQPAWVEQDAEALWRSVREAASECLEKAGHPVLAGAGITNQRESIVVWDRRTGAPAGPCVVWQCRRSAGFCAELKKRGLEPLLQQRTGLGIDPLFSASKLRWLLDSIPDGQSRAEAGELCAGTVDSWVLWNLSGGAVHACDASNAARTQLFDLRRLTWDSELLGVFNVPRAILPEVGRSSAVYGETSADGLPSGVPIGSLIGDSHAALFGHAAFEPGSVKATYGTGSSLMTLTEEPVGSSRGLSTTIAWWRDTVRYALEGNVTVAGGAVQWVGELLGLSDPATEAAALARGMTDTAGVYLVPAFAGLGAPYWDAGARGVICGLTRGANAAQLARASLESIAYQVRDVFEAMQADASSQLPELLADGGASRNDDLMQFQADILDRPVRRNLSGDLSAVGAAWLAGLALGIWKSTDQLASLPRQQDLFIPRMQASARERRYAGWLEAVAKARSTPAV
ncbi:MAG: glycerol kinase GlpK [Bryobacteraceae bacterium]|nr:glycerol kinase GlpK [Bryobacteraceae bacterium]